MSGKTKLTWFLVINNVQAKSGSLLIDDSQIPLSPPSPATSDKVDALWELPFFTYVKKLPRRVRKIKKLPRKVGASS